MLACAQTGDSPKPAAITMCLMVAVWSTVSWASGDVDPTFGQDGRVDVSCWGLLAVDGAGRPLVARADVESGTTRIGVQRDTSDGAPDATFGEDGVATVTVPFEMFVRSLFATDDGGVLLAGWKVVGPMPGDGPDPLAIVRLDASGAPGSVQPSGIRDSP
jgi:hypothetical protein